MLYIHSFSSIEQELFQFVKYAKKNVTQLNAIQPFDLDYLERQLYISPSKTLLYSFLDYSKYSYLDSFKSEVKNMELLIAFAKKNQFKNIILLSYPGVYVNSDNLFLQHKAEIENLVAKSEIPFTILSAQSIVSYETKKCSLQTLFYNEAEEQYVIPKKGSQIVYSIAIENLAEIILKVSPTAYNNCYDLMDSVYELKDYLKALSPNTHIDRISALYLNFRSFLGNYLSPTMLDLFLRPPVPMYKNRAEKEFEIELVCQEINSNKIKKEIKNPIEISSIGLYKKELKLVY
jgi:hypothetical protein